jgi:hypothetical protein
MNACHPKEYTIPGGGSMHAERTTQRQPPPLCLAPVGDKTVELNVDGGHLSSDAGLVMWLYSAGHTETRALVPLKRCVR